MHVDAPNFPAADLAASDLTQIRASFAAAASDPAALAATFYRRLFEAEPDLRRLFADNLRPQESKLAAMLAMVVAGMDDWQALAPTLAALGRRHADLGVRPEHFPPVGAALLAALSERTDGTLDPAAADAWRRAFARITAAMT